MKLKINRYVLTNYSISGMFDHDTLAANIFLVVSYYTLKISECFPSPIEFINLYLF